MAGHGSAPPPDRASDRNRVVHRDTGMNTEEHAFTMSSRKIPAASPSAFTTTGAPCASTTTGTSTRVVNGASHGRTRITASA